MGQYSSDVFDDARPDIIVGVDPAVGTDRTVMAVVDPFSQTLTSLDITNVDPAEEVRALPDSGPSAE